MYVRLNEVKPHRGFAKDGHIATLRWLLLDLDAQDHAAGRDARRACRRVLWRCIRVLLAAAPSTRIVIVDSGTGYAAWIEHEARAGNDPEACSLRQGLLHALAAMCDTPEAHVDVATYNASRLARIPGTWNYRSDRRARIVRVMGSQPLPIETLSTISGAYAPPPAPPTKRPSKSRGKGKKLPVAPPIDPEALLAIRQGCALWRAFAERQEQGLKWERETWRYGSGVILPHGGEQEVVRLDLLAQGNGNVGDLWSGEAPPATCRAFAKAMSEDPACPPELHPLLPDCGTLHSPCGFAPEDGAGPSPFRHASHTRSPASVDLRDVRDVAQEMGAAVAQSRRDLLLAGGCGSRKSSLMRGGMRAGRHLVAAVNHALCIEWESDLRKRWGIDVVRIPKLEDACSLPPFDSRRARMKLHRSRGRSGALACKGCPVMASCPYWTARNAAKEARIVVITHALLATGSWKRICGEDRTLWIDEDPLDALAPRHAYDAPTLLRIAQGPRWSTAEPDDEHEIDERTALISLAAWLHQRLQPVHGLAQIRADEVPIELLAPSKQVDDEEAVPLRRWASYVATRPTEPVALLDGEEQTVTICWRASVPKDMPLVVADATPDPVALGRALGRELEPVGGPTAPTTKLIRYFDVQVSQGALRRAGPHRERALDVLRAIRDRHKDERLGIVTTKKLLAELPCLSPPITIESAAHYGAARGSNSMRTGQVDVGAVLGVPRVPLDAVRGWAFFLGGAALDDLQERGAKRAYQERGVSYRTWGYSEGSAMDRADRALTLARLQQAAGRLVGVPTVYVIADYPLGLGEELRCAAHDLRVPLLPVTKAGRRSSNLSLLVDVVREFQRVGRKIEAAACAEEARARGWKGTARTAQRRLKEVLELAANAEEPEEPLGTDRASQDTDHLTQEAQRSSSLPVADRT